MSRILLEARSHSLAETGSLSDEIYRTFLSAHRLCLLLLDGDLGAGKTAWVHALGPVLGIHENINSPTFNLLNVYENETRSPNACDLYHYDLYRLNDPGELDHLDFLERWQAWPGDAEPARLHAIEWWQRAGQRLPVSVPRFRLQIEILPAQAGDLLDDYEEPRKFTLYALDQSEAATIAK